MVFGTKKEATEQSYIKRRLRCEICAPEMNFWSAPAVLALCLPTAWLWVRAQPGFTHQKRERGSRTPNGRSTNPGHELERTTILLVALSLSCFSPTFAQQEIILATTTSVEDSGLLAAIVPIFEREQGYRVKAIAVGSGQALALAGRGEADVILAHAPDAEKRYVADGSLVNRRLVMHNTFLLAGPATDSAEVKGTVKAVDALRKIAEAQATFVSRGDDSGTHKLEKKLWEQASIKPAGERYLESGQGMGRTLSIAGEKLAYVISDRATYLAFRKTTGLAVLLEGDPLFLNIYHVMEVNPEKFPKVNATGGKAFADFLLSASVQDILKTFGVDKFGEALFRPDAGQSEEDLLQQQ